jgi:16S rRNA (adenine1518-N6/adenine1519-N6)-dimethyltransferase
MIKSHMKFTTKKFKQPIPRGEGGFRVKKEYGQHFLRKQSVVDTVVNRVVLDQKTSVFEIGGGDGFLTRSILKHPVKRLWVFEIDRDWAQYLPTALNDARLKVFEENILDVDWSRFEEHAPWVLLANLPYNITFPILHMLQRNRTFLKEGVIMVQEEVAQKIVKKSGRGYGYISLFFQHYFEWELLEKILPSAFHPAPKVNSRLLYFKPRTIVNPIVKEEAFWKFIKLCFHQPRRTLKNNLGQSHFDLTKLSDETLALRSQQLTMDDLLALFAQVSEL